MKLKRWVEIVLLIIAVISGIVMMIDVEVSIIPFIVGSIVFFLSIVILNEYGTLFNKLIVKIDKFLSK